MSTQPTDDPRSFPSSTEPLSENTSSILLDGWWERRDRSLLAAVVTGMLVVGAVYFNGGAILSYCVVLIATMIQSVTVGDQPDDPISVIRGMRNPLLLVMLLAQFGLMLTPSLLLIRRLHTRQVRAYVRLRAVGLLEILLPAIAAVAMVPVNLYLVNLLMDLLHMPELFRELNDLLLTPDSIPGLFFLWLVIGVTPAVCEEVFFRGYIQRTFERVMGWKSVLLTGLLFGLFHMQPLGLFTLSLLGVLFGFYYYRSRSLIPGMVAHFTNNAVAVYLYYAKPVIGGVSLGTTSQIPIGWMPASVAMSAACIAMFYVVTRMKSRREVLEKPDTRDTDAAESREPPVPAQDQDPGDVESAGDNGDPQNPPD